MAPLPMALLAAAAGGAAGTHIAAGGATFAAKLYQDAIFAYKLNRDQSISYTGISSGSGNCRMMGHVGECVVEGDVFEPSVLSWAGSEIPFTQAELERFPDLRMYPTAAGAVVPVYNLPVVNASSSPALELTMTALARVLTGIITSWHDPELVELNPWLQELPPEHIRVVVGGEGSGTTRILRQSLASEVPYFRRLVEGLSESDWGPNATSHTHADGNFGMAAQLLQLRYSIGYLSLAEALDYRVLRAVNLVRGTGTVVVASYNSVNLAVTEKGLNWGLDLSRTSWRPDDVGVSALGLSAWPITSLTYMVLRMNTSFVQGNESCSTRQAVFDFLEWFYTSSSVSKLAADNQFVPLPVATARAVVSRIADEFQCNGKKVVNVWPREQRMPISIAASIFDIGEALKIAFNTPLLAEQDLPALGVLVPLPAANSAEVVEKILCCDYLLDVLNDPISNIATVGLTYAETYDALSRDVSHASVIPVGGVAVSFVYSLCGTSYHSDCVFSGRSIRLDLDLTVALIEGEVTTWADERLLALNEWMGEEPAASILMSTPMVIFADELGSEAMFVLQQLLQRLRPELHIQLGAFLPGGVGRTRSGPRYIKAAVAATPLSIGIVPLVGNVDPPIAIAPVRGPQNQGQFIAPGATSVLRCASDTGTSAGYYRLSASQDPECYPLSVSLYMITKRDFSQEECTGRGEDVPAPPVALVNIFAWGMRGESAPLRAPFEEIHLAPLFLLDPAWLDQMLLQYNCAGKSILERLGDPEPGYEYLPLLFALIGAVACLVLTLFTGWKVYSARFNDLRQVLDETSPEKELLALFANPRLPMQAQDIGLRPLSFGQDIKHLLRSMDMRDVAIEPAATLEDAQRALICHRPRIVVFSGHTFMGALAFEDTEGKIDRHARPETFAELLQGRLPSVHTDPSGAFNPRRGPWFRFRNSGFSPHGSDKNVLNVEASQSFDGRMSRASAASSAAKDMLTLLTSKAGILSSSLAPTSPMRKTIQAQFERVQCRFDRITGSSHSEYTPAASPEVLAKEMVQRLECVVLNGCKTEEIGKRLLEIADHISVVCWASLAEDNAARAFATGFYESVQRQRRLMLSYKVQNWSWKRKPMPKSFKIEEAFKAGCESFARAGFTFGNPEDFLHPPGHPHHYRPDFAGCLGCMPPVHGECLLLRSVQGVCKITSGSSLIPRCENSRQTSSMRRTSRQTLEERSCTWMPSPTGMGLISRNKKSRLRVHRRKHVV